MTQPLTFQELISKLNQFWANQGCIIHQGYDLEVGAGTFNPATFLRCLGKEPYRAAYVEPCRRPSDGRYGTNPNRLQHYFQYQVVLKPSPENIQELYLKSLEQLGFNLNEHDIRFVHDDWENPTIGAWGLGWEVWMDGMEITQFTYFQQVGGVELRPITGEITYGLERLAMYLQKKNSIFDLTWNEHLTYGDIYHRNEIEWSHYNFENANTAMWKNHFEDYEREAKTLIQACLPIPAYDFVMKASHAFNILDARGVISVTERTGYIGRIRELSRSIAEAYIKSREAQGFPLLKKLSFSTEPLIDNQSSSSAHRFQEKEDFLLEIGSEELPASFVSLGSEHLKKDILKLFEKENISYDAVTLFATPRRLAIFVQGLSTQTPAIEIEKKGPSIEQAYDSNKNMTPAGNGFFRSLSMDPISLEDIQKGKCPQITLRNIKGTSYLYSHITTEGKSAFEILRHELPSLILNLEFPKKMRWGTEEISYARPLRWIVALLGTEVIPFRVGSIFSKNISFGHRQMAPQAFSITQPRDYETLLKTHFVIANSLERKKSIEQQIEKLEEIHHFNAIEKDRVLPQVLNLVEWPVIALAHFKPEFLKAPKEVLISEMVEHQKYFPLCSPEGSLLNRFLITANIPPTPCILEGNEKVISARLSDGVFLYEEDLKTPLEGFNEKLKKVTFQKQLGSVFEKVERIILHAESIQHLLHISTNEKVRRAALFCKADLASNMVYEFPELQGVMGTYFALFHGEDNEVAQAINEHWMPRGEHAPLPQTETGICLSLADKVDNLLGCFALGLCPTSSSDPYALRRQVIGIIKMIIKGKYSLSLKDLLLTCSKHFSSTLINDPHSLVDSICSYITNRVKNTFLEYGFRKDEIEASLSKGCNDIYDAFSKVQALHDCRAHAQKEFKALFEVYKRAKGQLQKKIATPIDSSLFVTSIEHELFDALTIFEKEVRLSLQKKDYLHAYATLAKLQPPLSALFEQVKILSEDLKLQENRLALLQNVFSLFDQLLDFSKLQEE